ncbi:hypothetical protein SAMN05421734_10125 [Pelagirhabdus alkalitolerans]|uniref:Uncharacterized protein n=2 Tax=Pelagirhabdus alkalitolerans TaxID=1612202 RepID=A0A1G6GGK1_9BACI|nr:hypothetical protein SAMN05421734_10125 [Pelagirhabdus alkalitolerans]
MGVLFSLFLFVYIFLNFLPENITGFGIVLGIFVVMGAFVLVTLLKRALIDHGNDQILSNEYSSHGVQGRSAAKANQYIFTFLAFI